MVVWWRAVALQLRCGEEGTALALTTLERSWLRMDRFAKELRAVQSDCMEKSPPIFKEMKVYSMRDGAFAITCVKLPAERDEDFRAEILKIRALLDSAQWEVNVAGGSVLTHLQHRDAEWSSKMSELGRSSGGCTIARTEERAISLSQLEAVAREVDSRCEAEAWTDIFKNTLVPSTVNLYVVAEYIIKQATEAEQCSYVEIVACAIAP